MQDYNAQIFEFIKRNFEPTYPDLANAKFTSEEFLGFLFLSFPVDCISDYELNDILLSLDFERFTYTIESISFDRDEEGEKVPVINHHLVSGWCMFTNKMPAKK
jgi:hypothetical protein